MSDFTRDPMTLHLPDRSPDEVDRLLTGFFQAEIPNPWPAWVPPQVDAPVALPFSGRRPWVAMRCRLAVAASVALVLGGYLLLASAFPGSTGTTPSSVRPETANFPPHPKGDPRQFLPGGLEKQEGVKSLPPQTVPVPRGGRAHMWEQHFPRGKVVIQLQDIPSSGAHP
jgi:hypothetical protein